MNVESSKSLFLEVVLLIRKQCEASKRFRDEYEIVTVLMWSRAFAMTERNSDIANMDKLKKNGARRIHLDSQSLLVSFDALSHWVLMNLVCGLLVNHEFKSVVTKNVQKCTQLHGCVLQ